MKIVLTNNAKFNPYTFDEMLKPLAMAAEAYNTVQSGIEELGAKADLMKMYANEVPDSRTANMYNNYANDLEKQASMLAKYGLTPASRQGLLKMRRRYSSEITPIEKAVSTREELTKEQRDALMKDPSLMFDIDYSKTQLDYFIGNANPTYSAISGNELTKRASQMAASLSKVMQDNPRYQAILGGQYFQQMQQMGYTPTQIMQTILEDRNAPAELRQIVETVFDEAGLSQYSQDIQDRSKKYIYAGLYDGIGTTKYDVMNNRGYVSPAEQRRLEMEEERLDMAKEQHQLQMQKEQVEGIPLSNGNTLKLVGGKFIEIAPDGTYVSMLSSSGSTTNSSNSNGTKLTPSLAAKQASFTRLDYTSRKFKKPGRTDRFDADKAILLTPVDLEVKKKVKPDAMAKLIADLEEYGLSLDDVDIYVDEDKLSNDHYRVVKKGTGVYGLGTPESKEKINNPSNAETGTPSDEEIIEMFG